MPKKPTRADRWFAAAARCREEYDKINSAADGLAEALMELNDIRGEYEDWFDNLPENLQDGPTGQKLAELTNLDIESYANEPLENWGDVDRIISDAEGADLPMGFGRD